MKMGSVSMSKESVLKVDKDCHVDYALIRDYAKVIKEVCRIKGVKVTSVEMTRTQKGQHFYIGIYPPVHAHLANELQWLLGDDFRRFDYNRARIRSRYPDWNKLFEDLGRRFWVLYRSKVPAGTRKTNKGGNGPS
jgi:hypothetical protein